MCDSVCLSVPSYLRQFVALYVYMFPHISVSFAYMGPNFGMYDQWMVCTLNKFPGGGYIMCTFDVDYVTENNNTNY